MLTAAIGVVAADPPALLAGDIVDTAGMVAASIPDGCSRVVFHAATRAHVPADRRADFDDAIVSLGESGPLHVVSLEGPTPGDPAPSPMSPYHVLKLTDADGNKRAIALVDGHAEWMQPLA